MLKTRDKVASQLANLREIQFQQPTARELHYKKGHLVRRVQRQESKRYRERVERQKIKLQQDLVRIDAYILSLDTKKEIPKPVINLWDIPARKQTRIQLRKRTSKIR